MRKILDHIKHIKLNTKEPDFSIGYENFEKKFIANVSFIILIIAAIGFLLNIILGMNVQVIFSTVIAVVLFLLFYFWACSGKRFLLLKTCITITAFMFGNFYWVFNYGSEGPAVYFFIISYSLIIFIWRGKTLIWMSVAAIANIGILFYIDYTTDFSISNYDNFEQKLIDIYTTTLMYGSFTYVLLKGAKDFLQEEYLKATKADRLKTSFLENMSHEIRTPLNAIVGFSNMLASESLPEHQRDEFASIIESNNEHLLRLIDDILDMSKIESNTFEINNNTTHLNTILNLLKASYKQKLRSEQNTDINVKFILPPSDIYIKTDGVRVNQVLVNLIDNAIKFTESGSILISLSHNNENIKFSVQDSGRGIREADKEFIFDRFHKGSTTNGELIGGTGIGLYLCKQIVELMGGNIWVESRLGMGSTFSFTLPINELVIKPSAQAFVLEKSFETKSTPPKKEPQQANPNANAIILVVEDIDSNMKLLTTHLNNWNYHYHTATTGISALLKFTENRNIDLVLLDINLPDINGYEVYKKMREIDSSVKIVAQTAYAMKEDEARCRAMGFDGFIRKPIETELLRLHLRHHLKTTSKE